MKPKIVIDTNVIIAALRSNRGPSYRLLQLFGLDKFTSHVSVAFILEYEAVAMRLSSHLNDGQTINEILDYICAASQRVKIYYLWRPHLDDPKDDMVLELAVASGADFIVTYNIKDFKLAKKFGIKVVTPKELLISIGERS